MMYSTYEPLMICSSDHMFIATYDDTNIWWYQHMITSSYVPIKICSYLHMYTSTYVHRIICCNEHMIRWTYVIIKICSYLHMYASTYVAMNIWFSKHMFTATYEHMLVGQIWTYELMCICFAAGRRLPCDTRGKMDGCPVGSNLEESTMGHQSIRSEFTCKISGKLSARVKSYRVHNGPANH